MVVLLAVVAGWMVPPHARAGQPPAPVPAARYVVCHDGMVLELRHSSLVRVAGPVLPGAQRVMGGFVPGFLPGERQRELADLLPGTWRPPRLPAPGLRPAGLPLVVLDPGHGGDQKGAIGTRGTREKELVLDVARRALDAFAGEDVEVVATRLLDEEVSLWDRVALANQLGADLFVSIHANAFPSPSLGGVETFFHSIEASEEEARRVASFENAPSGQSAQAAPDTLSFILEDMQRDEKLRNSSRLAHLVQERLARAVPFENRGVMQADFVVLRGTRMPSVLLELGFLTNPREEKILNRPEVRERIARAIRQGVMAYLALFRNKSVSLPREVGLQ